MRPIVSLSVSLCSFVASPFANQFGAAGAEQNFQSGGGQNSFQRLDDSMKLRKTFLHHNDGSNVAGCGVTCWRGPGRRCSIWRRGTRPPTPRSRGRPSSRTWTPTPTSPSNNYNIRHVKAMYDKYKFKVSCLQLKLGQISV